MYIHACQTNLIIFASVNLQFSPACLFASVFIATFDLNRCTLKLKLSYSLQKFQEQEQKIQRLTVVDYLLSSKIFSFPKKIIKFNLNNENKCLQKSHTHALQYDNSSNIYLFITFSMPLLAVPQFTILHWHMLTTWSSRSFLSIVIWQLELGHGIILQSQLSICL